jgi:hypothetical protein
MCYLVFCDSLFTREKVHKTRKWCQYRDVNCNSIEFKMNLSDDFRFVNLTELCFVSKLACSNHLRILLRPLTLVNLVRTDLNL